MIDELQLDRIDKKTQLLSVAIQQHHKIIIFDIVIMANHNVVLGMP